MTAIIFTLSTLALLRSRLFFLLGWKFFLPMVIGWAIGNVIAWLVVP